MCWTADFFVILFSYFLLSLSVWGETYGGHVSDVTLYTASRKLLHAGALYFAFYCHVGDVTSMR